MQFFPLASCQDMLVSWPVFPIWSSILWRRRLLLCAVVHRLAHNKHSVMSADAAWWLTYKHATLRFLERTLSKNISLFLRDLKWYTYDSFSQKFSKTHWKAHQLYLTDKEMAWEGYIPMLLQRQPHPTQEKTFKERYLSLPTFIRRILVYGHLILDI